MATFISFIVGCVYSVEEEGASRRVEDGDLRATLKPVFISRLCSYSILSDRGPQECALYQTHYYISVRLL